MVELVGRVIVPERAEIARSRVQLRSGSGGHPLDAQQPGHLAARRDLCAQPGCIRQVLSDGSEMVPGTLQVRGDVGGGSLRRPIDPVLGLGWAGVQGRF